jgi:RNA polymerase sigma factor (sigma-70 family)
MVLKPIQTILYIAAVLWLFAVDAQAITVERARCENPITSDQRASIKRYLNTIDRINAEDALQEALISFLEDCRKGTVIDRPESWLRTTAKHHLLNMIRTHQRRSSREMRAFLSPLDELGTRAPKLDQTLRLYIPDILDAGQKLSEAVTEEQLRALYGRYVDGLTARQIAVIEDAPLTTIQGRLRRSEKVLGNITANTLPSPPPAVAPLSIVPSYVPEDHSGFGLVGVLLLIALGMIWGFIARRREHHSKCEWEQFTAAMARAEAKRQNDLRNWYAYQRHRAAQTQRYLVAG